MKTSQDGRGLMPSPDIPAPALGDQDFDLAASGGRWKKEGGLNNGE